MEAEARGPVLLAYDGSDAAGRAIASAGPLLEPRTAQVAYAFTPLARSLFGRRLRGLRPELLADAEGELEEAEAREARELCETGVRLAEQAGLSAQPLLLHQEEESVWQAVTKAAGERQAEATVIGAHGHRGLAQRLLGSSSQDLVEHSRVPVLAVPAEAAERASGPALLCYDDSTDAQGAIEAAGGLLADKRALVLSLWQSWTAFVPRGGGMAGAPAENLDDLARGEAAAAASGGSRLAQQAGFEPDAVSARAGASLWQTILDTADEQDASVIVMGQRGLSGLSALLGSVSHGVVQHATRPVLIVPSKGGAP